MGGSREGGSREGGSRWAAVEKAVVAAAREPPTVRVSTAAEPGVYRMEQLDMPG